MKGHKASAGIAVAAFLLLSVSGWGILKGLDQLYRLESHTEAEQTMNALFTSLRSYNDFGSAIEQNDMLKGKVLGIGIYGTGGNKLYSWGAVPESYDTEALPVQDEGNQVRMYRENADNRSLILILRPSRMIPPPPPREAREDDSSAGSAIAETDRPKSFMFEIMGNADIVFLELRQPEFWNRHNLLAVLSPIIEALLAGMVFFVWLLFVRNREYQEKLEKQKNLVVLGTAASMLAHEIKNPLLAIRLQASILEKILPEESKGEVAIINDEVDRISRLTSRINDYLRDPRGFPRVIDPADIAAEVGLRLCGRPLVASSESSYHVLMDPERFRSIMENILRNAIESGGRDEDIAMEISASEGRVFIDVLDRGTGIPPSDRQRVFDPFFTTKSKGTGIGLAICERFAREAGGVISLENRPGGGLRTRVSLPEASS